MLVEALKARIPLISVSTDDIVHCEDVVQSIAPLPTAEWKLASGVKTSVLIPNRVYWTFDEKEASLLNYRLLEKNSCSLIIINPSKPNDLVLDVGILPTPEYMIEDYLKSFTTVEQREKLLQVLKGVSLKRAIELVTLTIGRVGGAIPSEVRKTRLMLSSTVQGLMPINTDDEEFFQWPKALQEWVETNEKYFLNPLSPAKLVPRGLLLSGAPGTGKTSASRAIARKWNVPLYRFDLAQAMNRFQGETQQRLIRALQTVDAEDHCVLLLDEIEKLFTASNEADTSSQCLSIILYWMQEHKSRVFTIMTTNQISKIPEELYRSGRLDMVLTIPKLSVKDAKQFSIEVYKEIIGDNPTTSRKTKMATALENKGQIEFAHSEVCGLVFSTIKENDWLELDNE